MIDGPLLITGGASGIGKAVAVLASQAGTPVGLLDVDGKAIERTASALGDDGGEVFAQRCDVADPDQVAVAVATMGERLGAPRALVTAAGIDRGAGPLEDIELEVWQRVVAVNLNGTFHACRAVLPGMVEGGGGAIVCISSPLALVSLEAGSGAYSASKAGITALVRDIAVNHGPDQVRANALLPGPTETDLMWASAAEAETPPLRQQVSAEVPLRRIAEPHEIARAALWLLSAEASFTTGASLACDGGVLAKASVSA